MFSTLILSTALLGQCGAATVVQVPYQGCAPSVMVPSYVTPVPVVKVKVRVRLGYASCSTEQYGAIWQVRRGLFGPRLRLRACQ